MRSERPDGWKWLMKRPTASKKCTRLTRISFHHFVTERRDGDVFAAHTHTHTSSSPKRFDESSAMNSSASGSSFQTRRAGAGNANCGWKPVRVLVCRVASAPAKTDRKIQTIAFPDVNPLSFRNANRHTNFYFYFFLQRSSRVSRTTSASHKTNHHACRVPSVTSRADDDQPTP